MNQSNALAPRPNAGMPAVPNPQTTGAVVATEQTRAMVEVQAQYMVARANPRDENACFDRMMKRCERFAFANEALYLLPVGNSPIPGLSIRAAESMMQLWGNCEMGTLRLHDGQDEQGRFYSECVSFARDFETNAVARSGFRVYWIRESGRKGNKTVEHLSDPAEVQRMINAFSARHERNVMLKLLPPDIKQAIQEQCEETVKRGPAGKDGKVVPLPEQRTNLVTAYAEFKVSQKELEEYAGLQLAKWTQDDVGKFRSIYRTIKDGAARKDNFFGRPQAATQTAGAASDVAQALGAEPKFDPGFDSEDGEQP